MHYLFRTSFAGKRSNKVIGDRIPTNHNIKRSEVGNRAKVGGPPRLKNWTIPGIIIIIDGFAAVI